MFSCDLDYKLHPSHLQSHTSTVMDVKAERRAVILKMMPKNGFNRVFDERQKYWDKRTEFRAAHFEKELACND